MTSNPLSQLIETYQQAPDDAFALFLGAGTNLPAEDTPAGRIRYPTYSWYALLQALYERNQRHLSTSFDYLRNEYGDDWQGFATALIGNMRIETFVDQLEAVIYSDLPRSDRYRRLSKRFVEQAPALQAAIAFTARVRQQTPHSWTFERNPKIGAVITTNYDFFFGAGWTRYEAFPSHWKVQTPFSKQAPRASQRPVYYVHGYLPYATGQKRDVVLTRSSFEDAYSSSGFATRVLQTAIERYRLLFLGVSFDDPHLRSLFKRQDVNAASHVMISRSGSAALEHAHSLGITAIPLEEYSEIPGLLGELYCQGLSPEEWRRVGVAGPDAYWDRLLGGVLNKRGT